MGDSDDEYRRRGREKFMKERNDFQDKRRDFQQNGGGNERRGYMQGRADFRTPRGRPDMSPPMKRMRRDWADDQGFDPSRRDGVDAAATLASPAVAPMNVPSLMSFKQFLTTQDDSISDEDAMQKYQEYKLDFKRQQLHAFFVSHKEEEWFRLKYHPEDSAKRKEEQHAAVRKRLEIFQELWQKNWLDKCSLDHDNGRNLVKFMDAVVVKLEGGSDEDLAALEKLDELFDDSYDSPYEHKDEKESEQIKSSARKSIEIKESSENLKKKTSSIANEDGAISDSEMSDKGSETSGKSKTLAPSGTEADEFGGEEGETEKAEMSGRKKNGDADVSIEESAHGQENCASPREMVGANRNAQLSVETPPPSSVRRQDSTPATKMMLHKTSSIFLRNLSPAITKPEVEALCKRFPGFLRVSLAEPIPDRRYYRRGWVTFRRDVNIKEICWNLNSIRLKDCDMGPIVNRDLTRRIRVANGVLSHRQVAQNDLRLAARLVQIFDKKFDLWQEDSDDGQSKKNLSSDQFDDVEFNFTSRNPLLKNITDYLIEEASAEEEELLGTFASKGTDDADQKIVFERSEKILKVLDRILLYLRIVHSIDYYNHGEYPCEDEMPNRCGLIHVRGPAVPPSQYGADEQGRTLVSTSFVKEFCKNFENHLQPLLAPKDRLAENEAEKLGRKEPEKEVEAFVNANCQELAKDKWLCPLSGKKFKGPEFVRKHILNKHCEKLDEVRDEVTYFNNYLFDPKRPGPVESKPQTPSTPQSGFHPTSLQPGYASSGHGYCGGSVDRGGYDRGGARSEGQSGPPPHEHYRSSGGGYGGGGGGNYYRNQGDYGGGGGYRRDHYQRRDFGNQGGYGGNRGPPARHYQAPSSEGRRDPRVPVTYTDLDAPEDVY